MKIQFDLKKLEESYLPNEDFLWLTIVAQGQVPGYSLDGKIFCEEEGFIVVVGDNASITRKGMLHVGFDSRKCESWIEEYRMLFPPGAKQGKWAYRGSKQGCIGKMNTLLKERPDITKEQILETTKRYVATFKGDYEFMVLAHYFINKNNISQLEGLIDAGVEAPKKKLSWGISV